MRSTEEGPRFGSSLWLMAFIVVTLNQKIDSVSADLIIMAIALYAMWKDSHSGGTLK
jgi:hypothetical protein